MLSMKKLIRSAQCVSASNNKPKNPTTREPVSFDARDIVEILTQIEELQDYNIAIRNDDQRRVILDIGDSSYVIQQRQAKQHPRRQIRKIEN